ncbi:MAG: hypothetical protein BWX66_01792 [Deltaproteobacteria bacterium ADurb.Bin058]|nr:MAG: hypothetical protein BWX66_01792 [Deltaproteobacteria bacterium ADurb.Bin058]
MTLCFCDLSRFASLADVVVFPVPWRPTIITAVGRPPGSNSRPRSPAPISSISSSLQSLTKCSAGVISILRSPFFALTWMTSPMAFSLTRVMKAFTTLRATSASNNETLISRKASSMTDSVSTDLPDKRARALRNPFVKTSNILLSS